VLAGRRRAVAVSRQELQAVAHRAREALDAEHRSPGGGQLDGQGQAIDRVAHRRHRCDVGIGEPEAWVGRLSAVDEQCHRAGGEGLLDVGAGERQLEGGQPEHAFGGQPQAHLAGDDQLQGRGGIDQKPSQPADVVPQVLGIVEREQKIERPDGQGERVERLAAAEPYPERLRDRCR